MILKKIIFFTFIGLLGGCFFCEEPEGPPVYYVVPTQPNTIALEHPYTRVLAYCSNSLTVSAEDCAKQFEQQGYVRLQEIPRLPAEYDMLKTGTYPTRRWREGETVSRW